MARKISFDLPTTEDPQPRAEPHENATATVARPLLGLERPIKQSSALGAISHSLDGISEKVETRRRDRGEADQRPSDR